MSMTTTSPSRIVFSTCSSGFPTPPPKRYAGQIVGWPCSVQAVPVGVWLSTACRSNTTSVVPYAVFMLLPKAMRTLFWPS